MALPGWLAAWAVLVGGFEGGQVQPAGIDLRVDGVEVLDEPGYLGVEERRVPRGRPLEPVDGLRWRLPPGAYRIVFMDAVSIPSGAVGLCFPRSSLLRMGVLLGCAVWDPGYRGRGAALLIVANSGGLVLERGARVAQLVLVKLDSLPGELYRGRYQGEGLGEARGH